MKVMGKAGRFWLLMGGLVGVQIAWVVFAILSLFTSGWQDGSGKAMTCFLFWELASIGATLIVTVVFWGSCFLGKEDGMAFFDGSPARYPAFAVLCLIVFCNGFVRAAWCAWVRGSLTSQAWWLASGVIGTIAVEVLALVSTVHPLRLRRKSLAQKLGSAEEERMASEVRAIFGNRDNIMKYLCFSDIPIAFAIGVLSFFVITHDSLGVTFDEDQMRSFMAGAVALQLLYSNFVFLLEGLADYPRGYKLLGKLPISLRPIRYMLHPTARLSGHASVGWAKDILERFFREDAP